MSIIDINRPPRGKDEDIRLEPGVIIVHCAYVPDTGAVGIFRSERAKPPVGVDEQKVEMDNHFTVLCNAIAMFIASMSRLGVNPELLTQTVLNIIHRYLAVGGTDKERRKIIVGTRDIKETKVGAIQDVEVQQSELAGTEKINYDAEIEALGYTKLSDTPWAEHLAANKEAIKLRDTLQPADNIFASRVVFRKEIYATDDKKHYIEISREKELKRTAVESKISHYVASFVLLSDGGLFRRAQWEFTMPAKIAEQIPLIEREALAIICR